MSCVYGCKTDGRPCPRPHTCHTLGPKLAEQRAIDNQINEGSSWNLVDLVIIVGAVAIIGFVLAPYAAGYLSHMKG